MVIRRIDELLKKTVEITGYSEQQVASVISHFFSSIKKFIFFPTKAGIRLPYIGVIRTSYSVLRYYLLTTIIPAYREGRITKERFQHYWKLRELIRKDEQRRDFTTRFGPDYLPNWRQGADKIKELRRSYENGSRTDDSGE